jgi:hypothetical protein
LCVSVCLVSGVVCVVYAGVVVVFDGAVGVGRSCASRVVMADIARLLRAVAGDGERRPRGQSAEALAYVRRCKVVHGARRTAEAAALRVVEQAARHNEHDAVRPGDLIGESSLLHPRILAVVGIATLWEFWRLIGMHFCMPDLGR